jgi:hypothetical protein
MAQGTTKGVPIDIDPLLAADSDLLVPSQKAIKTYVDNSNVNQVTSVTGTSPIASTGGTTPVISIPQATGSVNGYLSSADFTTFSNKQNALANPVTGVGLVNEIAYFTSTGSTIASLPIATYPSLTELSYVKGVTSAVQPQLNSKGYTLSVTSTVGNLLSGTTYYFGSFGRANITAADQSRVYIPKTGTIKKAYITQGAATAGTTVSITISIRLNNTTDTLVATSTAVGTFRTFINNALSISVTEGDYIEMKVTNTSATAPTSVVYGGTIYIE